MADARLPLLRGRITSVDSYQAPQQGGGVPPAMPSLDPKAHRAALIQQLDALTHQVSARAETARDELARREIIAVRPAANTRLAEDQLDDAKADARLVGVLPGTGTVLLDVASADLGYLREKIEAFADDSKVIAKTTKDGSPKLDEHGLQVTARAAETAIAPVAASGSRTWRTSATASAESTRSPPTARAGSRSAVVAGIATPSRTPSTAERRSIGSSTASARARSSTSSSAPSRSTSSCARRGPRAASLLG